MRIDDWPMDKIMQLPDWAFGRQWPVITSRWIAPGGRDYWISGQGLPERIVVWEVNMISSQPPHFQSFFKIYLGDHDPATQAEVQAFEPLWKGDFESLTYPGGLWWSRYFCWDMKLRQPVAMMGRRFAYEAFCTDTGNNYVLQICIVVSGVPKEIPDWLGWQDQRDIPGGLKR